MIQRDRTDAETWLLSLPPTRGQTRWVFAVAGCQLAALVLLAPFAGIPLGEMNGFIPAVESVVFVTEFVTSVLLFSQFATHRLNALLVLACGYLWSALIIIPHALSFPGAFSPLGLPGAGLQTTPWLYWFWHFPFAMALLGYGVMRNEKSQPGPARGASLAVILRSVALVLALVFGLVLVATAGKDYLPALFADSARGVSENDLVVYSLPAITMLVCVSALAVLWRGRRSVLDQWLMIVVLSVFLEIGIVVLLSPKRFDVGFYAGRLFSLLTSTTVLVVLLVETMRLYANRARSNEGKIRRLVDANIIGIIIGDLDGTITDSNDAFLQMLGYDRNDVARKSLNWMEMAPAEWRKVNDEHAAEIKSTGIASTYEMELLRRDGSRVPVLCGAATFDEARGQAVAFVVDLTERKRADEALRRSEERVRAEESLRAASEVELTRAHRSLIDAQRLSRTGSYIADLISNEHHWSEELYRIYELEPGTKIDTDELRTMVHPEDRPSFEAVLQRARTRGVGVDHHFRIVAKSGKVKHLHSVGAEVLSSDGRVEIVGALQDVTEQKTAEEALRRSEAFLAKGQTLSQTGTFSWCLETEECIWSDELYRIYEFEPGVHITFEKIATRYHPDDKTIMAGIAEQARRCVMSFDYGHRLLMPNGSIKHIHVVAHRSHDADGRIEYFGAVQDVTQRHLADEARRLSEGRWKRIVDNSAIGIAVADLEGRFEIANAAFQKLIGFTEEELREMTFLAITESQFREQNSALTLELLRGKRDQFNIEKQYRCKDGRLVWARNNVSLLPGADGTPRNIMAIVEDISSRKIAEGSLHMTQARLARAAELATAAELSASIAHEINQPLSGIVTNTSTCLRMLGADPPNVNGARETARRTLRDGNRASEIVTRLRALFNKKPETLEMIDLNGAAREVIALLSSALQANHIVLRTDFAGDLYSVKGDRVQLQQVILNLIQNAIESMMAVDDRIRELQIETKRDERDHVRLAVKDTGIGLTPEALDRVFESFYTTKSNGMGIGLAISRSIVKSHQGRLWAEPNDGPGATFYFSLPQDSRDAAGLSDADSALRGVGANA